MATQHAIDETDIRQRIDRLAESIRTMDLEGVMPIYAPNACHSTSYRRCSTWEQRHKGETG